jgi:deoxyhypusine monooxygenase
MGAISASDSIPILKEYLSDSDRSVRETCEIAIARIEWDKTEEGAKIDDATKDENYIP